MKLRIGRVWMVLAGLVLAWGVWTPGALAVDRVTLKGDQGVVEGEIIREIDGYVWIRTSVGGVATEKMYTPDQVSKIERQIGAATPAPKGEEPRAPQGGTEPAADEGPSVEEEVSALKPGVPRALVLTLGDEQNGDMVGLYLVAHALERAIPTLEKELGTDRTGVVVLRFHSGGGLGAEVQKVSDLLHNEFKTRWRTVGWIESAISAAAMSAHCLEELYFTSQANYGACTGFYGSLDRPVEGFQLELALEQMRRISARAGWDPLIMEAMQIQTPVSASVDENGQIRFFRGSDSGQFVVNRTKEILTLNARSAERIRFSRGTADSLEELTKQMGYKELQWVGKQEKGFAWPISRAERIQIDYRKQVKKDEDLTNHYFQMYGFNVNRARSVPREERPPYVAKAREALNSMKRMVKNNPNFSFMVFNREPEQMEEFWKELDKELRDLLK